MPLCSCSRTVLLSLHSLPMPFHILSKPSPNLSTYWDAIPYNTSSLKCHIPQLELVISNMIQHSEGALGKHLLKCSYMFLERFWLDTEALGPQELARHLTQIKENWRPLVTRSQASSVRGVVAEMRQIHMDYQVLWRKRDGRATLSRGKRPHLCFDRLLLA